MNPINYTMIMKGKDRESKWDMRLKLVRYAQQRGIREAARSFGCSRNTVRLWMRRYELAGVTGLAEQSRAPHRIPHKAGKEMEGKVLAARKAVPCYGPRRLKSMFEIPISVNAIARILKEQGMTRKPRKKHRKKNDLRMVKAQYRALTHHQMDIKYLNDLSHYYPFMRHLNLPKFQYTIRDTKSGALFLAFASELNMTYTVLFVKSYLAHLQKHGIDTKEVIIQTDLGAEFSGKQRKPANRGFTFSVEELFGASHRFIPAGCANANADVESSHNLIEREFYDLEGYASKEDFIQKVATYQSYFNFARPNGYKGNLTPWDIVSADLPAISPTVLSLFPVILDNILLTDLPPPLSTGVGQYVPGLPEYVYRFA